MKILIVDDSSFSQRVAANCIKKYIKDCEIYFASDGKDGFQKYSKLNPDYVFIDLLMPKLNGKELIKLLKEYDSDAKIFVISADVQKNVKEEIEAYNIMAFINKPFNDDKAKLVCNMIKCSREV